MISHGHSIAQKRVRKMNFNTGHDEMRSKESDNKSLCFRRYFDVDGRTTPFKIRRTFDYGRMLRKDDTILPQ